MTDSAPSGPTARGFHEPGAGPGSLEELLAGLAREDGGAEPSPSTGRTFQEPRGMALMEALGFQVPGWTVVHGPGELPDLDRFPGERVVLKLLDPRIVHRTDVGGVQVVAREKSAVRVGLSALAQRASGPDTRFLVQEWIPHETDPGGELLLGYRWTREFGPVVTLGLGGLDTEVLTRAGRAGALQWIGVPGKVDGTAVRAALEPLPLAALATGRTRGRAGRVTLDELVRTVTAFLGLARAAPAHGVLGVEVNPLIFRAGRPLALDVLVRTGHPVHAARRNRDRIRDRREQIGALLQPGRMAVVGASAREVNPGRVILRNLVRAGFPRSRVQVVKKGCRSLEGCPCVPEVAELAPVDTLVVSVAAGDVPGLLEEVTRRRLARSVILISAGLGEGAVDAEAPEPRTPAALARILAMPGAPAVNGGNCLGVRSRPGRYDTLFIPSYKLELPGPDAPSHPVALLAQSGAFAVARVSGLPWLDPRYVVTVGNQVDLTVGEYMEAFLDDPELRVVAAYVEGFRPGDGRRFLDAAARHHAAGRTVLLYRAGRTAHGADAMASHTASVAGSYAVTRALAEAHGVLVADTIQEFQELLALAVRLDGREVGGRGAAFLSNAGFECVAMADGAGTLLPVELGDRTAHALGDLLRGAGLGRIVPVRNPLDVTPILGDAAFARAADILLSDEGVDVAVVGCVPLTPSLQTLPRGAEHREDVEDAGGVAAGLGRVWRETRKAWLAVVDGGPRYQAFTRALERHGIPVLGQSDRAVALLGRYVASRLP